MAGRQRSGSAATGSTVLRYLLVMPAGFAFRRRARRAVAPPVMTRKRRLRPSPTRALFGGRPAGGPPVGDRATAASARRDRRAAHGQDYPGGPLEPKAAISSRCATAIIGGVLYLVSRDAKPPPARRLEGPAFGWPLSFPALRTGGVEHLFASKPQPRRRPPGPDRGRQLEGDRAFPQSDPDSDGLPCRDDRVAGERQPCVGRPDTPEDPRAAAALHQRARLSGPLCAAGSATNGHCERSPPMASPPSASTYYPAAQRGRLATSRVWRRLQRRIASLSSAASLDPERVGMGGLEFRERSGDAHRRSRQAAEGCVDRVGAARTDLPLDECAPGPRRPSRRRSGPPGASARPTKRRARGNAGSAALNVDRIDAPVLMQLPEQEARLSVRTSVAACAQPGWEKCTSFPSPRM